MIRVLWQRLMRWREQLHRDSDDTLIRTGRYELMQAPSESFDGCTELDFPRSGEDER